MNVKKALIIDGNFIMMKNMFGLIKDKLLYGYFHRSLEESMKTYSNLHFWDEIYFVSDSIKSLINQVCESVYCTSEIIFNGLVTALIGPS